MKRLLLTIAAVAAPLCSASGQANLSFSGGNGGLLTIGLSAPVQYTITSLPIASVPSFVFTGAGNLFSTHPSITGSINYSINGVGAYALTRINSGVSLGQISPTDIYFYGFAQPLVLNDVVRLNAGTLTSLTNFSFAPPTSGAYATFIADEDANIRSSTGVSVGTVVPEPASFALMAVGLLGVIAVRSRRRV